MVKSYRLGIISKISECFGRLKEGKMLHLTIYTISLSVFLSFTSYVGLNSLNSVYLMPSLPLVIVSALGIHNLLFNIGLSALKGSVRLSKSTAYKIKAAFRKKIAVSAKNYSENTEKLTSLV